MSVTLAAYIVLLEEPEGEPPPTDFAHPRECGICHRLYGGDAWLCLHQHSEHGL